MSGLCVNSKIKPESELRIYNPAQYYSIQKGKFSSFVSVGIISAPREVQYLGHMLDSFFTNFDEIKPHVFQEPGCKSFYNSTRTIIHQNEKKLGIIANWIQALQFLINLNTPWIMICEDDIEFVKYAHEIMIDKMVDVLLSKEKRIGFLSPYCSKVNARPDYLWDWSEIANKKIGLCGTLCLCIPRTSAFYFLRQIQDFYRLAKDIHLDFAIGETFQLCGLHTLVHTPTLIHHLGVKHSTLFAPNHKHLNHPARQSYDLNTTF